MSHQPRKRFGQNFLKDDRVIHAIVNAIAPKGSDHVVEIGPGQGALTAALLDSGAQLDVVELDRDLVELLNRRYAGRAGIRVHGADALRFDFAALAGEFKLRIVGNLPYNISTPLLFRLFDQAGSIADMHFMLQKEVVERLCAEPGGKDWGRLGVMARYHCQAEWVMDVAPESFYPVPKVMSAVVRLLPHVVPPVALPPDILNTVVAAAFSQRRKTLRNALGKLLSPDRIEAAGVDPGARAETLTLEQFAALGEMLAQA
ncbi:MAG: 16S rRNA (adenine(1518)-N(6)/adenine(1519)-N(6))-dimethyltransferase RsmA [Methylococcaceae bacterium]|nr:16S rRNA (adenine(1518)-N(6)/adenine(1519)-N(6))-dimethyltransferase RsmA [Methylococcaceae bacterium]